MTLEPSSLGRYAIRGEIGRGNMGVVYRGYDPVIDRMVALKTVILPDNLTPETRKSFLERFLREARIAGKLLHPNIVVTYDAATDEETRVPFIVMELVDGEPLSARLSQRGPLPWKEAMDLVIPLARALGYAHDNGVVHRDIKPANIILAPKDVPKIADFGIAKLPAVDHTQTGTILGTPYFMSPEQLMGKKLDGRSDIFSLGVLLYSVVVGRQPFDGSDIPTIVSQVLHKNPRPISEVIPQVPATFDGILARALEKDTDQRYGTSDELAEDLLTARRGGVPSALRSVGQATMVIEDSDSKEKPVHPGPRPERPTPVWSRCCRRLSLLGLNARFVLAGLVAVVLLSVLFGHVGLGPNLPLELAATHHHMIGGCSGQLTLHEWGIEYKSSEHGTWQWEWDQIRRMERSGKRDLLILTREGELLGLVRSKPYNFTLSEFDLEDDFWSEYKAIALGADPPRRTGAREDLTLSKEREPSQTKKKGVLANGGCPRSENRLTRLSHTEQLF